MGDQSPQPLALAVEQPVPRPPVPGDLLPGQGPEPVGLGRWVGGEGVGAGVVEVGVEVMGASPLWPPPCPAAR